MERGTLILLEHPVVRGLVCDSD